MSEDTQLDFSSLLGMPGFSDKLLTDHFTLYFDGMRGTSPAVRSS